MEDTKYLDFDLRIERAGESYRVSVLSSPAGQATGDFALPFSDLELENFVLRMSRAGRKSRRLATPENEAARAFGGRLFEAVFAGEVRGCLRSSLDAADREGRGLRLRLHLNNAPELADIPWEYLYSSALNRFFALSSATPLVRYLDLPGRVPPLAVQPPLRLLAMIANPRDYPSLDANEEWDRLRGALKELEDAGLLTLERLETPTLSALQRRLRAGPCHILHFIGHGAFDESTQDGVLVLEDQNGLGRVISGQDLGVLLHDHHPMRLVVLNSCEGARTSRTDPFAGTAQSLIQQGMPAVVAMQFEISNQAAIVISHEFYSSLAGGYPVDGALAEARKAAFTSGGGVEWGTPVLYLRSADGRIFGVEPISHFVKSEPTRVEAQAAEAEAPKLVSIARDQTRRPKATIIGTLLGLVFLAALLFGVFRLVPLMRGNSPKAAMEAPTAQAALSDSAAREPSPTQPAASAAREPSPTQPAASETRETSSTQPAASGTTVEQPGAPLDELVAREPQVLTNSEKVYDLAVADDGVWAASSGGLLRWKADGTNALFTTSDGLPVNHLRALLSPEDGNLWMAGNSAAAVSALDGDELASVDTYTRGDGVDIGESPALMRDDDGSVWVASLYGEQPILRFDGSLWRPPPLDTDHPALEGVRPQIASLLRARDGAAWAGLSEDGILRYDGEDWTRFGPDQGVPAESVRCLLEDRAGVMWAAAGEGGLLKFESDAGRWERVEFQQPDAPVYWISELPDGSLWASGDYFILRSEDGGERWRTVASPEVGLAFPRRAAQDEEGRVWVATDQGIAVRDGEQWRQLIRPGEVSSYSLGRIYRAPDGRLWVLPQYGGRPTMVDPVSGEVTPPPGWPGGMSNVVSLAFEGGGTWAGLNDGLARVEDGTLERWDATDGLPGSRINALLVTADTLWIGGSEGLGKLDLQSGQIAERVEALDGQYVDALTLAPDGSVWAGAHWGEHGENAAVYRFSGDDREVWSTGAAPLERESAWVNAIAAAEDGAMWVASDTGVYRWDGERWEGWGAAQGAPSSEMFTLLPHAGAMWMAGDGGMLGRWDSESGWQRFRAQGLTSDVLAIQVSDEGSLWLGTQDGLLRYGP